jgi:methyltransferase (TIGR00027 family)
MTEPLIKGVSDTAFMVASWRAMESERPDALFRDPFAARLAGDHGKNIVASLGGRSMGGWQVVIRTVIIDDLISAAVAGGTGTILNLGAGLDARPYRMALPASLRWIEVDYPHVIDWKRERLAGEEPRCSLERVGLDLADLASRRKLFAAVSASSTRTLILTEGVIPYLTADDVGVLADDLRAVPGASWIVDYFSPEVLRYRQRTSIKKHMREAPFLFDPGDWFAFFARHGWSPAETRYIADESIRLHRPIPLPLMIKMVVRVRRILTPPSRRAALRRFAGYVLLKPSGA